MAQHLEITNLGKTMQLIKHWGSLAVFGRCDYQFGIAHLATKEHYATAHLQTLQSLFCTGPMRLFHTVNSLVVSKNLWLILLSKISLLLNLVKHTLKILKILRSPNLCFFLQLQWSLRFQQFCDFSLNKSCKTYPGTMMTPGGRK